MCDRSYKKRCHEAMESNATPKPKVMSIIIDGMDQAKCNVPYGGSQSAFSKALPQHITGVKEHGVQLCLYRTVLTVSKGADLTIHCILLQLEGFKKRHGYYPEKLYVQVDGGSENANRYVLGLLELLVVKRICRDVWYTRLPTGHTHEDIDACFGVIWSTFRVKPAATMKEWKEKILSAFEQSTLPTQIIDIWQVPDYQSILEPLMIKISQLHKDIQTQHQWRFQAVERSTYFPLGCKTTFRAYSSDKVVEFKQRPPQNCITEIGRATGLEPTTLYVRWYPSEKCDPVRRPGVEGMHLLINFPRCDTSPGIFKLYFVSVVTQLYKIASILSPPLSIILDSLWYDQVQW